VTANNLCSRSLGSQGRVYYASQISHSPPTFCLFCNKEGLFSINYKRYLERKFRESLGFEGTPLRFVWRSKRVRDIGQARLKGSVGAAGKKPRAEGTKGESSAKRPRTGRATSDPKHSPGHGKAKARYITRG